MTNFRLHHRAALRYQARPWLGAFRLLATVQALGNLAASAIAGILWTAVSPKAAFVYLAARLVLALGCTDTEVQAYRRGMSIDQGWVPQACALPTREQPLRVAEFDDLFATALHEQRRLAPGWLQWRLEPAAEGTVRDLIARESDCCSFFTFAVTCTRSAVEVDVRVPDAHVEVLDALAARAAARMPA